ncbi:MAG: beta-ketothiolase BktB [Pseudomonadales bacterium]
MQTQDVVIVAAKRTAIGAFGGSLKDVPPVELATHVMRAAMAQAQLDPLEVEHCVLGNVVHTQAEDMYLARAAALAAGMGDTVPAYTVNRLCGSGLQAVISAAQQIALRQCDIAVAGGAESMSRAPYWMPQARFGQRMGDAQLIDVMLGALRCPIHQCHMGVTAENVAVKYDITRQRQDAHALLSQKCAAQAIAHGVFDDQIVPLSVKQRRTEVSFERDEYVRADCTLEQLQGMRPAFDPSGSVTAGNASGINDGAAALVLMSAERARASNTAVIARLVDYSVVGVDPKYMGMGPVPAIEQLLKRCGLCVDDIDLFEINEAFAAQALAVAQQLNIPSERLNPNGSGISLGHPIGATGAVISVKALYELTRMQGRYAIVSLCVGGGQGIAALFERDVIE